ncbi:hypothetical protein C1Y63_06685 [Corynebacterium sp. 13CS0277]|nr:hypothetical protein C1Y63_06685 [Corynebacterium sp. 13CS0277]
MRWHREYAKENRSRTAQNNSPTVTSSSKLVAASSTPTASAPMREFACASAAKLSVVSMNSRVASTGHTVLWALKGLAASW